MRIFPYHIIMHLFDRRLIVIFGLVIAALLLGVTRVQAATYSVTITSTQFVPSTLSVTAGDSITFINSTTATQSAQTTLASGFNTGAIAPGLSKTVTVSNAGTYSYTSAYTTTLSGTVTVASSSSTATSSATGVGGAVPRTQAQPVSGTGEVLMALLGGGSSLLAFSAYGFRRNRQTAAAPNAEVVSVPVLSSKHHDQSES